MCNSEKLIERVEWFPNFKIKLIANGKYLIINSGGKWAIITALEKQALQSIALPQSLFLRLEKLGLIITKKNSSKIFNQYRVWNQHKYGCPSLHIIETTKCCNLQCIYCHMSAKQYVQSQTINHLDKITAGKIIDFIFSTPAKEICIELQGGESLLNFDIVKYIVLYAIKKNRSIKKNLTFSLVTNLITLNKEHCVFIKKHNIALATSLDGYAFVHNMHRKNINNDGSFVRFVDAINKLSKEGIPSPGLITVITKKTLPYVKNILEMYQYLGINRICLNFVEYLGRAKTNWDEIGLSDLEVCNCYKFILDYIFAKWQEGAFVEERKLSIAMEKIFSDEDTNFLDFRNPCGMIRGFLSYDITGKIFACDIGRNFNKFALGHVFHDTFEKIKFSPQANELISESLPNFPKCESCPYSVYCVVCPVLSYSNIDNDTVSRKNGVTTDSANNPNCQFIKMLFDYCFEKIVNHPKIITAYLVSRKLTASSCDSDSKKS
jgi:uncharacterized protein